MKKGVAHLVPFMEEEKKLSTAFQTDYVSTVFSRISAHSRTENIWAKHLIPFKLLSSLIKTMYFSIIKHWKETSMKEGYLKMRLHSTPPQTYYFSYFEL